MKLILDTNALSAYLDRVPEAVDIISDAAEVAIPVIVAGEFAFGMAQSRYRDAYAKSLQRMLDRCLVLEVTLETSRHYAAIRQELKAAGTPIPSNDTWIAALCRQHSMPVLSRDAHFDRIAGLTRLGWRA